MGGMVKGVTSFIGHSLEAEPEAQAFAQNYNEMRKEVLRAKEDALDAEQRGQVLAGLAAQRGSKLMAKQQVAYSAGGVDASVGTAGDVQAETAMLSELDSMTIRNNAMREALGHKRTADNAKTKQLALLRTKNAADTGRILTLTGDSADILAGAASFSAGGGFGG